VYEELLRFRLVVKIPAGELVTDKQQRIRIPECHERSIKDSVFSNLLSIYQRLTEGVCCLSVEISTVWAVYMHAMDVEICAHIQNVHTALQNTRVHSVSLTIFEQ
jgi:hypothetical protein